MPTYNGPAVSDAVIGFRKPITLQQGRALRDNPIAISEGEAGAPKVQGIALGGVYLGGFTLSSTRIFTGLGRVRLLRFDLSLDTGRIFQVQFSTDNGATFGTPQQLPNNEASRATSLTLNLETGAVFAIGPTLLALAVTFTVPANANAIRVSYAGGDGTGTGGFMLWIMGGRA